MSYRCSSRGCKGELIDSRYLEDYLYCATCKSFQQRKDSNLHKAKVQAVIEQRLKEEAHLEPEPTVKEETPSPPCETHPKFKAMRRPRTDCEGCWSAYRERWPERLAS